MRETQNTRMVDSSEGLLEDSQPASTRDGDCPLETAELQIDLEVNGREKLLCSSSVATISEAAECSGNRHVRAGSALTGAGAGEGCGRDSNRGSDANHRAGGEAGAVS